MKEELSLASVGWAWHKENVGLIWAAEYPSERDLRDSDEPERMTYDRYLTEARAAGDRE